MHDIVIVDERRNDERGQIRERAGSSVFQGFRNSDPAILILASFVLRGESLEFVARNLKLLSI